MMKDLIILYVYHLISIYQSMMSPYADILFFYRFKEKNLGILTTNHSQFLILIILFYKYLLYYIIQCFIS